MLPSLTAGSWYLLSWHHSACVFVWTCVALQEAGPLDSSADTSVWDPLHGVCLLPREREQERAPGVWARPWILPGDRFISCRVYSSVVSSPIQYIYIYIQSTGYKVNKTKYCQFFVDWPKLIKVNMNYSFSHSLWLSFFNWAKHFSKDWVQISEFIIHSSKFHCFSARVQKSHTTIQWVDSQ